MMRITSIFLISFSLITSSVGSAAYVTEKVVTQDCAICGHACCCPEICEPKLKEMKRKSFEQSHCDQSVSVCKLESSLPIALIFEKERCFEILPRYQRSFSYIKDSSDFSICNGGNSALNLVAPFLEVCTPPPKNLTQA